MKLQLCNAHKRSVALGTGILGAALLASVVLPLTAVAAPAPAPAPGSVSFSTGLASVTSSTHVKLKTSVSDFTEQAQASADSGSVLLQNPHGSEQHTWNFPSKPADLTVDSAGNGTLNLTAREGSYGKLKLTLAHDGKPKKTSCNGDTMNYVVTQPVSATGTFYFDSKSTGKHRWGTVGSKSKTFSFAKASVTYTYGDGSALCNFSLPCFNSISFDASKASIDIFGSKGSGSTGFVAGNRSAKLSSPKGATRSDFVNASAKMSFSTKGKSATLKLTGTGATSGTATVAGKNGVTSSEPCGKNKTMKATFWSPTSYQPGKNRFTVSEQIFGPITIAKTVSGTLSRYQS